MEDLLFLGGSRRRSLVASVVVFFLCVRVWLINYSQKNATPCGVALIKISSLSRLALFVFSFDFSDCLRDAGDDLIRVTL